jgi:uncharacterized protein
VHDLAAILTAILDGYVLPVDGFHGVVHWARVLENGLRIAETTGADLEVVTLFALFHDSRRVNEDRDDGHGLRGGELARSLRGKLVHLDDDRFDLLFEACRLHTDGHTVGDPALLACWDADRLDLGRVGITPSRSRLCTKAGRDLLGWAHARAVEWYEPTAVLASWGWKLGADPRAAPEFDGGAAVEHRSTARRSASESYAGSRRFRAARMLQNKAPWPLASSSATCVWGSGSNHSLGMFRLTASR